MSTPTLLAIVLNLQLTLQSISIANGYNVDVKASSVVLDVPGDVLALPTTEVPFFVVGHRIEPLQRSISGSRPNTVDDWWRIVIEVMLDASANDTASKTTALIQMEGDIEKAVAAAAWIHAGGATGARDALVQQASRYMGFSNQSRCFLEQPIDVKFNRTYGQP